MLWATQFNIVFYLIYHKYFHCWHNLYFSSVLSCSVFCFFKFVYNHFFLCLINANRDTLNKGYAESFPFADVFMPLFLSVCQSSKRDFVFFHDIQLHFDLNDFYEYLQASLDLQVGLTGVDGPDQTDGANIFVFLFISASLY